MPGIVSITSPEQTVAVGHKPEGREHQAQLDDEDDGDGSLLA